MDRVFSMMTILAMAFLAVVICVEQTLAIHEALGDYMTRVLLAVEAVAGVAILGTCGSLLRRKYFRQRKIIRSTSGEAVRQLRRLFAAVWS
jgi:hypothetical protein